MNIREKHHSGNGYALLLHTQFENHLSQISDNEIDTRYQNFKKNILKQSKFYTIKNVIASSIDFDCFNKDLYTYLNESDSELITFMSDITIRQVHLFRLMNEGKIMPCTVRNINTIEINLKYFHGNHLFEVELDLLPFETFIKV